MKEIPYGNFSNGAHSAFSKFGAMSACRFELTFGCTYRCPHCMTDCYNTPSLLKREVGTAEVKEILNKLRAAGVLWLCFTGGDPLTREDFFEIYGHAKDLGFLVTIFTNGAFLDVRAARRFARKPPFSVEVTVNAVTRRLYEKISGCQGSYDKAMRALGLLRQFGISFRVKTQFTQHNARQAPLIRAFIGTLGVPWEASYLLYPRLNGDLAPCALRVEPPAPGAIKGVRPGARRGQGHRLFSCALDSAAEIHVDPYGFAFFCPLLRRPRFDLNKTGIESARRRSMSAVKQARFSTPSPCRSCALRGDCFWCPGFAFLEKGHRESRIEYCCAMAQAAAGQRIHD